jgi:mono/diheme cytochrome c family protein
MNKLRIAILIGICAASLWPADSDVANRGREIYEKRCGGCHGLDNAKVGRRCGASSGAGWRPTLRFPIPMG